MAQFECPRPVTVSARIAGGSLDIVAEERDTAVVTVEPYDGTDAGRDAAAHTQIELHGDTLSVIAPESGAGWGRHSPRLRVDIRVPIDSSADVRVASATVTCHGRYGTARLNSASGACYIERVTGDLRIDTASGDVKLGGVDGNLRVKGASSDISVWYAGGDARLGTASGSVEVGEARGSVRVDTASGTVRLGRVRAGTVRVEGVSGNVSVGVAAGTGVWLDLRTLSGSTSSDLHVAGDTPPNGHDLEVGVRTVSGDIDVHRVAADDPPPAGAPAQPTPEEEATR